ncbi:hypothetical protein PMAYCL1PPCAC_14183, partial [Pristionchus mayeri]
SKMRIFLLLLLMPLQSWILPVGGKRQGDDMENRDQKKPKLLPKDTQLNIGTRKCYFQVHRNTSLETKARPEKSRVSPNCAGDEVRLSELALIPAGIAKNELELVEVRGEGNFEDFTNKEVIAKYEDKWINESHRDELGFGWTKFTEYPHFYRNSQKNPICTWPEGYEKKKRAERPRLLSPSMSVTVEEAKATLKYEGFLVHVGIREYLS